MGFGIAAAVMLVPWASSATAAPPTRGAEAGQGALADFEGRQIDLSQDWGEARACLIWRQGGVVECFRSAAAMDARAARLDPERAAGRQARVPSAPTPRSGTSGTAAYATAAYSCSSSLRLFDYNYYGGRQLAFWDRGYWQNLWDYGFDNRTSSYAVGGCYAHLAEDADGWGYWYPGPTYPYAGEPVMSSDWQDVVSSIYIE